MRFVFVMIFSTAMTVPALAGEPAWVGRWVSGDDLSTCAMSVEEVGDGLPMAITRKGVRNYESLCNINRVIPRGTEVELRLSCGGEGETWKDVARLHVEGDRLSVKGKKWIGDYRRCPQ